MKRTAFVLAFAFSLVAAVSFAQTPPTGMAGAAHPPMVDMNGDGTVGAGDLPVTPSRTGTTITVLTPWDPVPDAKDTFTLSNMVGGKYRSISRTFNGITQSMNVTAFTGGGFPLTFSFTESGTQRHPITGQGTLIDQNGDGVYDAIHITAPADAIIPLVYLDTTHDGFADYVSISWGFAQMVGLNPANHVQSPGAGGGSPQVFFPLADTNGDGKGDSILLDINGTGSPDPDLLSSPGFGPIAAPATVQNGIPTMSEWAILMLMIVLASTALWRLRAA